MVKYTFGIVLGAVIGFGFSFLLNKYRKKDQQEELKPTKVKINTNVFFIICYLSKFNFMG